MASAEGFWICIERRWWPLDFESPMVLALCIYIPALTKTTDRPITTAARMKPKIFVTRISTMACYLSVGIFWHLKCFLPHVTQNSKCTSFLLHPEYWELLNIVTRQLLWGCRNSTGNKVLALHIANLNSIPNASPLSATKHDSWPEPEGSP